MLTFIAKKYSYRNKNLKLKSYKRIKLSNQERSDIISVWGNDFFVNSRQMCYEFYKGFGNFSKFMVPNDVYAEAEIKFNPPRNSLFIQHKCALKYFIPKEHRPKTLIQNINDSFLDENDNIISKDEAIGILRRQDCFFIKVAVDSGGGRGVMKVSGKEDINNLLKEYKRDYICQLPIDEHETLAQYNPNCVNTIRVLSLYINNQCSILSSFIRMGGIGSVVDNLHSSKGTGVLVGLKPDGALHSYGIDKNYNRVYCSPIGEPFIGKKILNFDKVQDFVKYWHPQIPFAKLIGWDIILNKSLDPIVIEINLDSADIAAHQIFNGPIFGNRINEVLEQMNK